MRIFSCERYLAFEDLRDGPDFGLRMGEHILKRPVSVFIRKFAPINFRMLVKPTVVVRPSQPWRCCMVPSRLSVDEDATRAKNFRCLVFDPLENRFQARAMMSTKSPRPFQFASDSGTPNDPNGHASKKGNARAITIPIGSKQGHYVTLCAA